MDVLDRFTLLLLEPGEIYFEDYAVVYILPKEKPTSEDSWEQKFEEGIIRGRLKVCSKSLIFDPRDLRAPIVKFPYRGLESIEEAVSSHTNDLLFSDGELKVIEARSNQTVEVMERGAVQPYKFCRDTRTHQFQLIYMEISDVLPQIGQLQRASTLPPNDQTTMLQAIVRSKQQRRKFDRALLGDLAEKEVYEGQACKVTPLVNNPGNVLLTNKTLYFQPHNNAERYPVIRIHLGDVKQVKKRRYLLRQVGLEVFCRWRCMVEHILLAFKKCEERDLLYDLLVSQERVKLDVQRQDNMTYQWQAGAISNYDYLCYLNRQGDRSENDLTQYPVFPWVLADYVSNTLDLTDIGIYRDLAKPVGALNWDRLLRLKERREEMGDAPGFLYGSHYSTPGFVLYYLVRECPLYMLCLQNGRFDHPDRMFNSIYETWQNVTTSSTDFKELIPEFYNTDRSPDFLTNSLNINFGVRQNGVPVGDVALPPWAKGDPSTVVRVMREALESEYVSANIHDWIDLIFGYKQTGEAAEEANNVFFHMCYEGAVDLMSIQDINERIAMEVQISEFGQIPKQLFQIPHPKRSRSYGLYHTTYLSPGDAQGSTDSDEESRHQEVEVQSAAATSAGGVWQQLGDLRRVAECRVHREAVMGVSFTDDSRRVMSVGQDAIAKLLAVPSLEQVRSMRVGTLAASCCQHVPRSKSILIGSWDNNVYRYSLEYGQVALLLKAHTDAISCVQWINNLLVTGSMDATARAWSLEITRAGEGAMDSVSPSQSILSEMDHDSPVHCLALHPTCTMLATGTQDGCVVLWKMPGGESLHQLTCHDGCVHAAVWSETEDRLLTAGEDGYLTIVDPHQGERVCVHKMEEVVRCVAWEGRLVLAGGISGDIISFDMGTGQTLKRWSAHSGPILSLAVSPDLKSVVTGSEDRHVMLWGLPS